MITLRNTLVKIIDECQQPSIHHSTAYQDVSWFQEVLESFQDGILILSETGELVYANAYAYQVFRQINQGTSNLNVLPTPIWKLCESLLARSLPRDTMTPFSPEDYCKGNREAEVLGRGEENASAILQREGSIILSDEIVIDKLNIFWIRVRWLNLNQFDRPYVLMTIENRYESLKGVVLAEATKYRLTHREVEVWCLYRAKYTYKEIASHLFISINTVKKHIKNIHLKQQAFFDTQE